MTPDQPAAPGADGRHRALSSLLDAISRFTGARWTAIAVLAIMACYVVAGTVVGFDHWWQALIHSTAAVVTLPMLFVLQYTTNRETKAILIKLDELIQATTDARDDFMDLEKHEVREQEQLHDAHHHEGDDTASKT